MGQIARRRKKSSPVLSFRLKTWMVKNSLIARLSRQQEDGMPNASHADRIPSWLRHIWHLPDNIRWMDPLPPLHRRGIIAAIVVVLLAFLWPSSSPERPNQPMVPTQSGSEDNIIPLQAEISGNFSAPEQQNIEQGQWQDYMIASGQTLAQLFRDNNLPVNDVFAMAQVEGGDKPLSSLRAGQTIRIRQNAQGVITGLTLESDNGEILFTRQPDGSFIRVR